jgi:hypothetical protein
MDSGAFSEKKYPTRYLLTVEEMVENDYPISSYLSDMFTKADGWIETNHQVRSRTI